MFDRFNGNVEPFASDATGTNRTVFGGTTQSDDINDNLNDDFKLGWEIVGVNDNPTKQDFNALAYTISNLVAYLYQQGVAEWNASQKYLTNSRVIGPDGQIYKSLTGSSETPNVNNNPTTDGVNWKWEFQGLARSIGVGTTPSGNLDNGKGIALGDSDTGFRQNGDGVLEIYANNQHIITFDTTALHAQKVIRELGVLLTDKYLQKNTNAVQTIGANILVGALSASANEGGEIKLKSAPTSQLGDPYIDVVGTEVGHQIFRMVQKDASNNTITLSFPQVGGEVWSSGNDGAGSGLDADLLDSKHASQFIELLKQAGETNQYIAKVESGGGLRLGWYGSSWNNDLYLTNSVDDITYQGFKVLLQKAGVHNSSSGYLKLNNGLILQWKSSSSSATTEGILFPIAFPNGCHQVQLTTVGGTLSYATIDSYDQYGVTVRKSVGHGVRVFAIGY